MIGKQIKEFLLGGVVLSTFLLSAIILACPQRASAQNKQPSITPRGIWFRCLQDKWPDIQLGSDPNNAFIPETKQNLAWDATKNMWIDVKNGSVVKGACNTPRGATFKYCLQKQFPEIQIGSPADTAYDPVSKRNFAWDAEKQAWIDTKTLECICPKICEAGTAVAGSTTGIAVPPGKFDSCLVGNWVATEGKLLTDFGNWSGGSGFTITFKKDGTLNADYTKMVPLTNITPNAVEVFTYSGTASGLISTKDKVAAVKSILIKNAGLKYTISGNQMFEYKTMPSLGPGGLGSTAGENGYVCTDTSLVYKASSGSIGGKTDFAIKLRRLK